MEPIAPDHGLFILPEHTRERIYAANQPQYNPLPAIVTPDGRVISTWQPSYEEVSAMVSGRPVVLIVNTFNHNRLQPVRVVVREMDAGPIEIPEMPGMSDPCVDALRRIATVEYIDDNETAVAMRQIAREALGIKPR